MQEGAILPDFSIPDLFIRDDALPVTETTTTVTDTTTTLAETTTTLPATTTTTTPATTTVAPTTTAAAPAAASEEETEAPAERGKQDKSLVGGKYSATRESGEVEKCKLLRY